jgi:hypothetical protein
VRTGLQIGPRPRTLPGLNARWVPSTQAEWAAALPSVTVPDSLWLFDEASGDFLDRIGSSDFSVAAGTVNRGVATPHGLGIELGSGTARLAVSSTTFMDGGTDTNLSWLAVAKAAVSANTLRSLIGKRGGTGSPGWVQYQRGTSADNAQALVDGGTPSDLATLSADHGGIWSPFIGSWDWSAGLFLRTSLGQASDESIAVSDITTTSALTIGAISGISSADPGTVVSLAAAWDGHALTATERRILRDFFS